MQWKTDVWRASDLTALMRRTTNIQSTCISPLYTWITINARYFRRELIMAFFYFIIFLIFIVGGTSDFTVLRRRKAANQSINQSINPSKSCHMPVTIRCLMILLKFNDRGQLADTNTVYVHTLIYVCLYGWFDVTKNHKHFSPEIVCITARHVMTE
jgi:hypothetical protein